MAVPRRLSDRRWGSASRCRDEADSVFGQQQRRMRSVQGTRESGLDGRDYAMIRPSLSLAVPQGRCNQGTQVHLTTPPAGSDGRRAPCPPADWPGSDWLAPTTPSPLAAVMETMGIGPSPTSRDSHRLTPMPYMSVHAPATSDVPSPHHALPPCSDVGFVVTRSQPIPRPISATLHIGSSRCAIRLCMSRAHNPPLALSYRGGRHAAAKKVRLRCAQGEATKLRSSSLDTRVCPTGSPCKTFVPQRTNNAPWPNMPRSPRRDVSTATPCPAWTSPQP
ncbi:hypothetical protein COCC4DRAFT_57073 [Bipolaris maydis ATCC 48331]|uniref:Uncharacterized protein n=2 Tax=Cochliobolus heterostrophus TaxID=5016 RepID=M2TUP0_COCH5|nr:uncharacterized protein COCC4DRAFT_57073 [Bipolaris maydis ATCC 48331]EMD90239.1 hypothetical protein COCHEDRAFT_1031570 [Bipolaris maydis C5]ENI09547.1 hypothetical protein COCC4DRAFT_57073 [Bipolaris maydis ATCC 48331]